MHLPVPNPPNLVLASLNYSLDASLHQGARGLLYEFHPASLQSVLVTQPKAFLIHEKYLRPIDGAIPHVDAKYQLNDSVD